jgi:hypothetical protein
MSTMALIAQRSKKAGDEAPAYCKLRSCCLSRDYRE